MSHVQEKRSSIIIIRWWLTWRVTYKPMCSRKERKGKEMKWNTTSLVVIYYLYFFQREGDGALDCVEFLQRSWISHQVKAMRYCITTMEFLLIIMLLKDVNSTPRKKNVKAIKEGWYYCYWLLIPLRFQEGVLEFACTWAWSPSWVGQINPTNSLQNVEQVRP